MDCCRTVMLPVVLGALLGTSTLLAQKCTYDGRSFPDARSACAALLADQKPPQTVKIADLDQATGDVHCAGNDTAEGQPGAFDQWMNGVRCETGKSAQSASPAAAAAEPAGEAKPECDLDTLESGPLKDAVFERVAALVTEENRRFADDPGIAMTDGGLSKSQVGNIFGGRGHHTSPTENTAAGGDVETMGDRAFVVVYGQAIEGLTAKRVADDACLSKYAEHVPGGEQRKGGTDGYKASHPDFKGLGKAAGLEIDVTTRSEAARKTLSDADKGSYRYAIYDRLLRMDHTTGLAVRTSE